MRRLVRWRYSIAFALLAGLVAATMGTTAGWLVFGGACVCSALIGIAEGLERGRHDPDRWPPE